MTALRLIQPSAARLSALSLLCSLALPLLSACGYNTIPTAEEQAKAAWSEVLNQYQRRADLIPNLVETVKGYAAHEKEMLEARGRGARQGDAGDAAGRRADRSGGLQGLPGEPVRADQRAVAAAGGGRELSRPQGQPEFPGAAGAARRHREPHRGGAARLHRGGARLQHDAADLPVDALGDALVHRQRAVPDLHASAEDKMRAAEGRFRHRAGRLRGGSLA